MALTDNLIAYYKFEGDAADSAGANEGTGSNVTYSSSYGKISQGVQAVKANSSRITLGTGLSLTGNFSINFWARNLLNDGFNCIVQNDGKSGTSYGQWRVIMPGSNYPTLQVFNGNPNPYATVSSTTSGTTSTWHMWTFTRDGTNINVYCDGAYETQSAWSTAQLTPAGREASLFAVLNASDAWSYQLGSGEVDELGIWTKVLSSGEITALYNSGNGLAYPFLIDYLLTADTQTYTLTGIDVSLAKALNYTLSATAQSYSITGNAVVLSYTLSPYDQLPVAGSYTYDTENTAKKTWSQLHRTWADSHFMWSSPGANFTNDSVGAGTYTYDDE